MKTLWSGLPLLLLMLGAACDKPRPAANPGSRAAGPRTWSSFDLPAAGETVTPPKMIQFEQADLAQVFKLYAETSGRSIIRGASVPEVKVTFSNQTPLAAVELLQALDTVLAAQGIAMVFLGSQYVKAVPAATACQEAGPVLDLPADQLPDSSSFLIYIVPLRNVTVSQVVPALQPFAKLPNSIVGIPAQGGGPASGKGTLPNLAGNLFGGNHDLLILRDYSSNVRRMLQVLEKLEQR